MGLELSDLRYFLTVRGSASLTAAARTLKITQPSLTAAMQRLEKHFGTTLLLRDHRGVLRRPDARVRVGRVVSVDACGAS